MRHSHCVRHDFTPEEEEYQDQMEHWIRTKCNEAEEEGGKIKVNRRGYRRIILMTKMLSLYLQEGESPSECSIKEQKTADCMAIYFRSLPDPHITRDEFQEFLQVFSQG